MLIQNVNILKNYTAISGTMNYNSALPTLRMVERLHILPVLGSAQYAELDAEKENPLAADAVKDLLERVRMVIGPFFAFYHINKIDIALSDQGAQRLESDTNKTAFQYQVNNYRNANQEEGEAAFELLLQHLEDNLAAYPLWVASDNFQLHRGLFIRSGLEFKDYFSMATPYRNYWAMRIQMRDIEELIIQPLLGETLYTALKAKSQLPLPGWTAAEKELLTRLKKTIANYTVARSIPYFSMQLTPEGITVPVISNSSSNDRDKARAGADAKRLDWLIETCLNIGSEWLISTKNYLGMKPEDFPTWPGNMVPTVAVEPDAYIFRSNLFSI